MCISLTSIQRAREAHIHTLLNIYNRLPHSNTFGGEGSLCKLSLKIFSPSLASRQREESAPNLAVVEAFRAVKYSLTSAIASFNRKGTLPEKDVIVPNQKSCECMGTKKVSKCHCLPKERGLRERSIGIVKGKYKCLYNDPYARGERSGKRAKLDALSQAANARARAHAPSLSVPPPPPNMPSPTHPPHVPPPFTFFPIMPIFANRPH
jgi:hypothetical protein